MNCVHVSRTTRPVTQVALVAVNIASTTPSRPLRLAIGNDQRVLLPGAALAGGALLVLADTAARTLIAPQQLPVGVLTALIGVPVFLFLLARQPR